MNSTNPSQTISTFEKAGAVLRGHFKLSSGLHSGMYLQCAKVLENPRKASTVCRQLAELLAGWKIDAVASPAIGGILVGYELARALKVPFIFAERRNDQMVFRRGFTIEKGKRYLVAEDVMTTGGSARAAASAIEKEGGRVTGLAALVKRGTLTGKQKYRHKALLNLKIPTYTTSRCPLCREGIPLEVPGSRHTSKRKN